MNNFSVFPKYYTRHTYTKKIVIYLKLKFNWSTVFYLTTLLVPTCAQPWPPGELCVGRPSYPHYPFLSITVVSGFGTLRRERAEGT